MEDLKMIIGSQEPDILLFTGVIPKAQQKPINESQLNVNGYNLYCNFDNTKDNLESSEIRGVAIYIKENLISKEMKLTSTFEDHVWVEIKLTSNEILLCGCVYRSPTKLKNEITDITLKVSQVITEASLRNPNNLLICGDCNYPEIDWEYEYANDNSESITPFLEARRRYRLRFCINVCLNLQDLEMEMHLDFLI